MTDTSAVSILILGSGSNVGYVQHISQILQHGDTADENCISTIELESGVEYITVNNLSRQDRYPHLTQFTFCVTPNYDYDLHSCDDQDRLELLCRGVANGTTLTDQPAIWVPQPSNEVSNVIITMDVTHLVKTETRPYWLLWTKDHLVSNVEECKKLGYMFQQVCETLAKIEVMENLHGTLDDSMTDRIRSLAHRNSGGRVVILLSNRGNLPRKLLHQIYYDIMYNTPDGITDHSIYFGPDGDDDSGEIARGCISILLKFVQAMDSR